ncbi:MAG: COG1615 family transporter [Synechococcales cyanobacterium RM1_1_8]|nr:COG1615 family transporter [Synechococcales cyanobacterium RM1_1_8]
MPPQFPSAQPPSAQSPSAQPLPGRRRFRLRLDGWIGPLLGVLAGLFLLDLGCWLMAESLWFQELGYGQALWLRWLVRLGAWALALAISAAFIGFNFRFALGLIQPTMEEATNPLGLPPVSLLRKLPGPGLPRQNFGAMGLRSLVLTVVGLALLLSLLLYHYAWDLFQTWQWGQPLLQQNPSLPVQFNLYSLGQDVLRLLGQPWQGLLLLGNVGLLLVAPCQTLVAESVLFCLGMGLVMSSQWMRILSFFQPTAFGILDPQFGRDASFYIFTLPVLELLRFWVVGLLLFTMLAVVILYIAGDGSLSRGIFRGFSGAQQRHLHGLGGGLMAAVALSHWLSRYGRLYSQRGSLFGASYTDVKVQLPVDLVLTAIASLIAIALLLRAGGWNLPGQARSGFPGSRPALGKLPGKPLENALGRPVENRFGKSPEKLLTRAQRRGDRPRSRTLEFFILHPFLDLGIGYLLLVLVVGNALPMLVQQLVVLPNELERERPYITRSIEATRRAFGLDQIEVQTFDPIPEGLSLDDLGNNRATLDNIRLWDTRPLLLANRQLQQIRLYYSFPDADIDRYSLQSDSPSKQQVIVAARELDYESLPEAARTWVNRHLVYTHGYGFTLSPVNTVGAGGLPNYFVKDIGANITLQGIEALGITEQEVRANIPIGSPRIYYGSLTNTYVMTSTRNPELDYPSTDNNAESVYGGSGGIGIGNLLGRWAFAVYLRDWQMGLTRNFTPQTKLLFRRNIQARIQTLAPFLRFDADPYLVIADPDQDGAGQPSNPSHLYWMVDAYTTSDRFPYSEPGDRPFNYIRNSVKVVIDAYNGSVNFYIADSADPIIRTWSRLFPKLLQPLAAMPPSLRDHIRYPVDLFDIQSERLLIYHMTDASLFYNREDQWQAPREIYANESQDVEPYYVTMRLPTAEQEEFVLLHPFTPVRRNNLVAWLAGRSDGDNYGKLLLYQFPKQRLIYGPEQIEARINQDPQISQLISLWNRQGSRVVQGNLLVIPIEQSLLYVEPLYLEAERNSIPTLIRVVVAYGNRIVMEESLERGLSLLFETEETAGQAGNSGRETAPAPQLPSPPGADLLELNRPIQTEIGNPSDASLSLPSPNPAF